MKKRVKKTKRNSTQDTEATFDKFMEPAKYRFRLRNILQVIIGATILAIPIGFTEETWKLGETLPLYNIMIILLISILFIALFAYRNFSKNIPNFYWSDLAKRVAVIYVLSFLIVALILTLIQRAPWNLDWFLAFKRTVIVTFPSSLGATLVGSLK